METNDDQNQTPYQAPDAREDHAFFKQPYVLIVFGIILVLVIGYILFGSQGGDKQAVLTAPAPDATIEEQEEYETLVESVAEEASVLVIGEGCAMTPLVLRLTEGKTLVIQNNDSVNHTVSFGSGSFFNVRAGDEREVDIMALFKKGEGIHQYRCNDQSFEENVGVLYITE